VIQNDDAACFTLKKENQLFHMVIVFYTNQ